MKKYLFLLLLVSAATSAQSISNYKYAIVPMKFSAQKSVGQFGLNEMAKQFLQKNGFTTYLDSEILPIEVTRANCNTIYVDVEKTNTLLKTKLKVVIKDCTNRILFTSAEGESSEKDNRVAYNQALRAAFKTFDKPEFRYNSAVRSEPKSEIRTETQVPVTREITGNTDNLLSAQPITNGYQLVDTTPKVAMKIFLTSNPDVYIGEKESAKGVVVKKNGNWVFEYYSQNVLIVEPLNIKF